MHAAPSCIYRPERVLRVTNKIVWNACSVFEQQRLWWGCVAAQACPAFGGHICYKKHHSRIGFYRWPPAVARFWVLSLEKGGKLKHFALFLTSSTVHIGRWWKLSTFEPKHNKTNNITACLAKLIQISLGILPVWPVFAVRVKKSWI